MKFIFIGGQTKSEHVSETSDDRGNITKYDEREGVDMPDSTTAFGIKFVIDRPTDVKPEMFKDIGAYNHAVAKLKGNQFFKVAADDVPFEEVKDEPPKPMPKVSSASPKFDPKPKGAAE